MSEYKTDTRANHQWCKGCGARVLVFEHDCPNAPAEESVMEVAAEEPVVEESVEEEVAAEEPVTEEPVADSAE